MQLSIGSGNGSKAAKKVTAEGGLAITRCDRSRDVPDTFNVQGARLDEGLLSMSEE
jgi:hypothetical protein